MPAAATLVSTLEKPTTVAERPGILFDEVETRAQAVAHCNQHFESLSAEDRVAWHLNTCRANMY